MNESTKIGAESTTPPAGRNGRPLRDARTELGRKLREIRQRIVARGEPPLGWDELDSEVYERRGEPSQGE